MSNVGGNIPDRGAIGGKMPGVIIVDEESLSPGGKWVTRVHG